PRPATIHQQQTAFCVGDTRGAGARGARSHDRQAEGRSTFAKLEGARGNASGEPLLHWFVTASEGLRRTSGPDALYSPFRPIRNQGMSRHPALQSLVFLRRTYVARDDVGQCHIIATVGEALRFLARLPVELDGIHWVLASNGLCWAHRQRELGTEFATVAFENALVTDGLLIDSLSPVKSNEAQRTCRSA